MDRESALKQYLCEKSGGGICLAFSGGVDSALLLALLSELRNKQDFPLTAVNFSTTFHAAEDRTDSERFAAQYGVPLRIITVDPLQNETLKTNPPDRCYHCKRLLFQRIREIAGESGIRWIMDGTNADDLNVYRPGRKALRELGVLSPLAELGIPKQEVRRIAELHALSVARKPSTPCLATRFPYGTTLTPEVLRRVEQGETILHGLGFRTVRLRLHGEVARIEIPQTEFASLLDRKEELLQRLQNAGFHYVTLDLEGFRSGSMDRYLPNS